MQALIIEEDDSIQELIVEILEEITEFKFVRTDNKLSAINLIVAFEFKLILIDYWTVNLVLDDLLEKIKESKHNPKIIIFTSFFNKESLEKHYKIKVISKPFDVKDLEEKFIKKDIDSI